MLKTCKNGHKFYKNSGCPTCPVCEEERKPKDNFLSLLAVPARRASENNGITTVEHLSKYTQKEVLSFDGIQKSSLPILHKIVSNNNLTFKERPIST